MASTPTRAVNLARQLIAITTALPNTEGAVRHGELECTVRLQPTPASQTYTVRLAYRHGRHPRVTVTDPPLELHPGAEALPHVYPGNELCLYYPGEWQHHMLLANTILPWTTEWLIHYELWLTTGRWAGGGHTHVAAGVEQEASPPPESVTRSRFPPSEITNANHTARQGGGYGRG